MDTTRPAAATDPPRVATRPARLRPFRAPVRGHAFAAYPPAFASSMDAGAPVTLAREPANPADPHAIAVYAWSAQGAAWRIGYLDRALAARLAPRMDGGARLTAALEGWIGEPGGRWQRPVVEVRPAPGEQQGPAGPSLWGRPPGSRRRTVPGRSSDRPVPGRSSDRPVPGRS